MVNIFVDSYYKNIGGGQIKKRIILILLCFTLLAGLTTGCATKKITTPPTTASSSKYVSLKELDDAKKELADNMKVIEGKVTQLSEALVTIGTPKNYQPDIDALKIVDTQIKSSIEALNNNNPDLSAITTEIDSLGVLIEQANTKDTTLTTNLTALGTRVSALESIINTLETTVAGISDNTADIATLTALVNVVQSQVDDLIVLIGDYEPSSNYTDAQVVYIGRRAIEVMVSKAGDYPVEITLYGDKLAKEQITSPDADIIDEFLFGDYTFVSSIITVIVPSQEVVVHSQTITSSNPLPTEPAPNNHQHSVVVPAQTITVLPKSVTIPTKDLTFNGTMLTIILEPDTAWVQDEIFELDIRDVMGTIYFATASAGGQK